MHKLLMALFLILAPLSLSAADLSGKWSGSMDMTTPDGQSQSMPVTAEFKQDGKTVTGSAGRAGDEQLEIQKGAIDGKTFTFEVQPPDGTYSITLTITSDSQLDGSVSFTGQDGTPQKAKLTLTKDK